MARQIYNDTWASGGDKVDPGAVKTTSGWIVEAPPHEFFNFWQGQTDEMLQHVERNGISEFNAATIYDLGGYAREGAVTFRSLVVTNTGNLPSTSPTEWVQAFLIPSNNLSDLADIPTAKTNLSLNNVDNTSDANKPVSTATQTALDLKLNATAKAADSELLDGIDGSVYARQNLANVFTEGQTIKKASATTELVLDATTGFDTRIDFKENAVLRGRAIYDESLDQLKLIKFDINGTTVKSQLDFKNDGDINVSTGILKVAGNLVMHLGNDGAGSGFDADLLDGIEGAVYARKDQAQTFTQIQTIKSAGANSALLLDSDTGFDTFLIFKENGVNRAQIQYDESLDDFNITKLDTNGTTVTARIEMNNNGDINVATGTLKQSGIAVANANLDNLAATGKDSIASAWIRYNGTINTIQNDKGFSSITDLAVGRHRLNFSTNTITTSYVVAGGAGSGTGSTRTIMPFDYLTTSITVETSDSGGTLTDGVEVGVAIFGGGI